MWSAVVCRRLCGLARYCGFNEVRQTSREKKGASPALHIDLAALFFY